MAENVEATEAQKPPKPKKQPKLAPTSQTLREYETIYLLRQDLTTEQLDRIKERLRGVIDREGGRVIRFTTWGRKKTAFLVGNKETRAVYVHLAFLAKGSLVAELERNLRNLEEVLKFQTIKISEAVDPATRPTEEDVVLEGDREEERPTREGEAGGEKAEAKGGEEKPAAEAKPAEAKGGETKPAAEAEPAEEKPAEAKAEAASKPEASKEGASE